MQGVSERRGGRIRRYNELREQRPALFENPPNAAFEIVFTRPEQDEVADTSARVLRSEGKPEEFADIGVVYEDRFVIAVRDAVRFRDGSLGPYVRLLGANVGINAAVLPVAPSGRVILVRQFRHDIRGWTWTIPRGFSDGGTGEETAIREIGEELGVSLRELVYLGAMSGDGGQDAIFLGLLSSEVDKDFALTPNGVEEGIDAVKAISLNELRSLIASGEVHDRFLLAAFALATAKEALGDGGA
jgi:ADP-ribose pyrophosphatase